MRLSLTCAPSSARVDVGPGLLSRAVSGKVSSALHSLTSVFGMGTGGPCAFEGPTSFRFILFSLSLQCFAESLKTEQRVLASSFILISFDPLYAVSLLPYCTVSIERR